MKQTQECIYEQGWPQGLTTVKNSWVEWKIALALYLPRVRKVLNMKSL